VFDTEVTAPEMGRLFAACIANSLVKVFSSAQRDHSILELGAGTGALAAELLNNLADKDALPERYMILEPSGSLQQLQLHCMSALTWKLLFN